MTKTLTVGQEVAVQSGYSNDSYMLGYVVAKITPTGQVVAKRSSDGYEIRFDKDGYETEIETMRLVVDLDAMRETIRQDRARSAAAGAVDAVRGEAGRYNDKESLQAQIVKLAELLEAARVAVDAI